MMDMDMGIESEVDKGKVTIAETAVVSSDVVFNGPYPVEIGEGTVVNPKCEFRANGGPIVVGKNNLIEERTLIENPSYGNGNSGCVLQIGSLNIFQVGSQFKGKLVGDANVFETKSSVDPGCTVGTGCVVGATSILKTNTDLSDSHVAYRYTSSLTGACQNTTIIRKAKRLKQQNIANISEYIDKVREKLARK
eukprot:CAMPEP_0204831690 /NCGR_PEP_ID=MMETSP1346-20131115/11252_1 /ASSEMBLY_ACC=CAM_ASM_000771 /TAXON_ID=215587 /ORGANISM="Aplanochytrium stocchinoi, Strain GSBS06" /LENGTH=192 /DNA_ID=CAMNT_0051962903 /DNA_START=124 /DNA_END=702 /DNA_ORIENTATION=-